MFNIRLYFLDLVIKRRQSLTRLDFFMYQGTIEEKVNIWMFETHRFQKPLPANEIFVNGVILVFIRLGQLFTTFPTQFFFTQIFIA